MRILLIDDAPEIAGIALPKYGYEVVVSKNGKDGFNVLKNSEKRFDLVLLDVLMPEMNGWEVLRKIRDDNKLKNTTVMMMTSLDSEADHVSALKMGADDYITKPFSVSMLLAKVEALTRRISRDIDTTSIEVLFDTDKEIKDLTSREYEIYLLVTKGLSNKEISERLEVSDQTVKTHLRNIFKKLNVSSRTQAILVGIKKGLIQDLP